MTSLRRALVDDDELVRLPQNAERTVCHREAARDGADHDDETDNRGHCLSSLGRLERFLKGITNR